MDAFLTFYHKLLDGLETATVYSSCALLGLLFCNEVVGVFFDIFGSSLNWTPELSIFLLSWVCFLGAGFITRHGGHIAVDFLANRFSSAGLKRLKAFYVAVILLVTYIMVFYGGNMAIFVGKYQASVYLQLSMFYYYLSIPVSGVLIAMNAVGTVLPNPAKRTGPQVETVRSYSKG
jgi:TRAP-type C4-dicarboxylate transport system permease small subunit